MARNYSLTTIKTLFAEASACAYPSCTEPLIFHDRGKATPIAEIAHIRSETPVGPRHDERYLGDVNGPENLILLCGKHHRPVDRHQSAYSARELEQWKAEQRKSAGAGTPVTEDDLRSYAGPSSDERQILMNIARLAQRVSGACADAQQRIDAVRHAAEQARLAAAARIGTVWQVDEQDNRTPLSTDAFSLAPIEQREWDAKVRAAWDSQRPRVEATGAALDEELAVLRMVAAALAGVADRVSTAAAAVPERVGDATAVDGAKRALQASITQLWKVANGEADGNIPTG